MDISGADLGCERRASARYPPDNVRVPQELAQNVNHFIDAVPEWADDRVTSVFIDVANEATRLRGSFEERLQDGAIYGQLYL